MCPEQASDASVMLRWTLPAPIVKLAECWKVAMLSEIPALAWLLLWPSCLALALSGCRAIIISTSCCPEPKLMEAWISSSQIACHIALKWTHVISCHIMSYHVISYQFISYHVIHWSTLIKERQLLELGVLQQSQRSYGHDTFRTQASKLSTRSPPKKAEMQCCGRCQESELSQNQTTKPPEPLSLRKDQKFQRPVSPHHSMSEDGTIQPNLQNHLTLSLTCSRPCCTSGVQISENRSAHDQTASKSDVAKTCQQQSMEEWTLNGCETVEIKPFRTVPFKGAVFSSRTNGLGWWCWWLV